MLMLPTEHMQRIGLSRSLEQICSNGVMDLMDHGGRPPCTLSRLQIQNTIKNAYKVYLSRLTFGEIAFSVEFITALPTSFGKRGRVAFHLTMSFCR